MQQMLDFLGGWVMDLGWMGLVWVRLELVALEL